MPEEFLGQRSLVGYSPWGHKESDRTEQLTQNFTEHVWTVMYANFFKNPLKGRENPGMDYSLWPESLTVSLLCNVSSPRKRGKEMPTYLALEMAGNWKAKDRRNSASHYVMVDKGAASGEQAPKLLYVCKRIIKWLASGGSHTARYQWERLQISKGRRLEWALWFWIRLGDIRMNSR